MGKKDRAGKETAEAPLICGICGTTSSAGTIICASCGASLGDEPELEDLDLPEQAQAEGPEMQEEPVAEEIPGPIDDQVEEISEEIPEPSANEEEVSEDLQESSPISDDDEEEETEEEPEEEVDPDSLQIKKTQLIFGVMLAVLGILGVAGLRSGMLQTMFGYSPSPGMGPEESLAQIVSMIPLMIGLVLIGFWGIKNDPIYKQIEKLKEEDSDIPDDEEPVPEEFTEPVPEYAEEEPAQYQEPVKAVEPDKELEELKVEAPLPERRPTPMQEKIGEKIRVERCEKMLSAVVVLPDDKMKLKMLIKTGISTEDFIEEVKLAVNRRKKREEEKDVTSDEKAAILEDELVAELAELEDAVDKEGDELEDEILKEIEDLEHL